MSGEQKNESGGEQKIKELEAKVEGLKNQISGFTQAIQGLESRISRIENNGIKSVVGDMQTSLKYQQIKVSKLERERKYGGF